MATRMYLPSSGTPPVGLLPTNNGVTSRWNVDSESLVALPMYTTKKNTPLTNVNDTRTGVSGDATRTRQWISPPLDGAYAFDTLASWSWVARGMENDLNSNSTLRGCFYLAKWNGATSTWDTWVDVRTNTLELTTTLTSRFRSSAFGNNLGTSAVNDRIVFDLGYVKASTASFTTTMNIGDNAALDLDLSSTDTDADNPYIEISLNLGFLPEPQPQLMMMGSGT